MYLISPLVSNEISVMKFLFFFSFYISELISIPLVKNSRKMFGFFLWFFVRCLNLHFTCWLCFSENNQAVSVYGVPTHPRFFQIQAFKVVSRNMSSEFKFESI